MPLDLQTIQSVVPHALREIHVPGLGERHSGKVRDFYLLPDGRRVLITTDRLSAFDRILGAVPYKGQVLNQLSAFWFEQTRAIVDNHMLAVPDPNVMVVTECEPFPVEVIVRGYITGVTQTALWYRYSLGEREIYGYRLPEGLRKNDPLPEPMITPTTKGRAGEHDERLTCAEVVQKGYLDAPTWERVMEIALALFRYGQEVAQRAGLILVDTKYEFGRAPDGRILLIDEVHTPDSSRFWIADTYEERRAAGEEPESLDKEYIRIWYAERGYRGDGDPPPMPDELAARLSQRYIACYEGLTGQPFQPASYPAQDRIIAALQAVR
ncbi:MAG: phosphoribosylaminoimidazolesuccinocarboxamide synthase [Anaerolineae bacterium]|nr:phosphoribosylaminoimidazolesuccinocarboxamide synthase [Anaerolineae bacterium]MDW8067396.1 phosphoribosylaminoimidazolesuccinocarboxamide synthase [Anaerolineae bacterium]